MLAAAELEGDHSVMGGVSEYMGDIMLVAGEAANAEEHFNAALDHRLQAGLNEANQAQANRTHLFKTAIASMVGDDLESAASRTAEYNVVSESAQRSSRQSGWSGSDIQCIAKVVVHRERKYYLFALRNGDRQSQLTSVR